MTNCRPWPFAFWTSWSTSSLSLKRIAGVEFSFGVLFCCGTPCSERPLGGIVDIDMAASVEDAIVYRHSNHTVCCSETPYACFAVTPQTWYNEQPSTHLPPCAANSPDGLASGYVCYETCPSAA